MLEHLPAIFITSLTKLLQVKSTRVNGSSLLEDRRGRRTHVLFLTLLYVFWEFHFL